MLGGRYGTRRLRAELRAKTTRWGAMRSWLRASGQRAFSIRPSARAPRKLTRPPSCAHVPQASVGERYYYLPLVSEPWFYLTLCLLAARGGLAPGRPNTN
jgi:hypothetical protein